MIFRDIREAEQVLFGGPTYSMSTRTRPPGKGERLDDMAQAWIEGRHEEVLEFAAAHAQSIRTRIEKVKLERTIRVVSLPENETYAEVVRMVEKGATYREIQQRLGVAPNTISRLRRLHCDIAKKGRA